ncbi:D-alanyl-D-alanine carboxypeptidase family protein [Ornithinibacillus californiensis]|uniref:D-alanyl-D-alanine carboxypeptidase family protein n=1 Tax=Ornithinibacillus californiensis TaxID=161536 RepID=UPI00069DCB73|nr:D-alanyl-D-alanine carboxypeptidase family protein [Ornithinibacillus californiensis]
MRILVCLNLILLLFLHSSSIEKVQAEEGETPNINSGAAIVIETNTGTVLFEENATDKLFPASLTKIATAIYALENGNLTDDVTVSENAYRTIGSSVFLEVGEEVSLRQLIEGLLVNSGNDAAIAIAEHLSGDVEQFSEDVNHYLETVIGVENTHFTNPHGLFDSNHYTTAEDLAMITQYALENEAFQKVFGLTEIEWNGENWDTTLYTHHKLLREMPYPGITGGKTGYIEEAGYTLATTANREDLGLIVITLQANQQSESYQDTIALLDYGFENFIRKGHNVIVSNDSKKTEFRKLPNSLKLDWKEKQYIALKAKGEKVEPAHVQKVGTSFESIPASDYEGVIMISSLVFLLVVLRLQRPH